jgi:type I restriction enzyme S subunit
MKLTKAPLGDLLTEARSGFASGERDPDGVVQLRMNNVGRNGEFIWDSFLRVPADSESIESYSLQPGDVLFNNTNSTELVGKSALFTGYSEPVVFSNHFTRLRTAAEKLDPGYLARWLNHQWRSKVFENLCNRWVGQSAIQLDALLPLELPLPPLSRQREIVARLDAQLAAAARARAAVATQLAEAERLLTKWINDVFARAETEGIPQSPLDTHASIQAGVTLGKDYPPNETVTVPYLRVANVKDGRLDLDDIKSIAVPQAVVDGLALRFGDLLLTEGGDPDKLGRGTIWRNELSRCIHQNHVFRVRFDLERFDPVYLSLQFRSTHAKSYFLAHAKQTTGIASINQQVLRAYPLISHSIADQKSLALEYGALDKLHTQAITALRARLAELDRLPAALLRTAFADP